MWIPKNEQEILDAVETGSLEESTTFDAKRELPPKNKNLEVAKDIAAMANDGGTLIYGIDEDSNQRLTVLNPIPLAGQPERINNIVRTSIAEPLSIHISTIPTINDNSIGYIVVVVPPSQRAPHMVVAKGEHRFYGRNATGNIPLSEGEVARLYERRQRWEVDQDKLLTERVNSAPLNPSPDFAYLHLLIRPLARIENLLQSTVKAGETIRRVLDDAIESVVESRIYPHSHHPSIYRTSNWSLQVDGYVAKFWWPENEDSPRAPEETLYLEVGFDGSGYLFCGRASERRQSGLIFYPPVVAGNIVNSLAFLGVIFNKANYVGMVDLGIAIVGMKGSVLGESAGFWRYKLVPYDRDEYRRIIRISALELQESPIDVARKLTMPLFDALSQGHLEPFPKFSQ